ncbi:MAG: sugar phosphate isomerase/epimerase [Phycisphaeraceae bacterium]|nr:sugar phosphate isomerase/epimerase [Phycisphaeraceae bacterium]
MKLSMMSFTMSLQKDFFDLTQMFDLAAELKLDGIDLVTLHDTPAIELRKMADDRGFPVVAHTFRADLNFPSAAQRREAVDLCREGIDAAVVLGAPTVMIPTPPKAGVDRDNSRRNWIAGLQEVIPFANDAGINLTVENFPGAQSPFVIATDLLEAVQQVPGLKVTYDNGNAFSGEEPAQSFKDIAEYVVHAHFKDWDVVEEGQGNKMLNGKTMVPALIGEGAIDTKACLKALIDANYDQCINIEYCNNKYNPTEAVRMATKYLRNLDAELMATSS